MTVDIEALALMSEAEQAKTLLAAPREEFVQIVFAAYLLSGHPPSDEEVEQALDACRKSIGEKE